MYADVSGSEALCDDWFSNGNADISLDIFFFLGYVHIFLNSAFLCMDSLLHLTGLYALPIVAVVFL